MFFNLGRKKKDYQTKTISFRVRLEFVEPIKKMVKNYLSPVCMNATYIETENLFIITTEENKRRIYMDC